MSYVIRSIRPDEWPAVKELRLAALQDPVAHLAFLETFEQASARPDAFWQERAASGAEGALEARQIVAESTDGRWAGTLTVLIEDAGTKDWAGLPVERNQGHVVGVFIRPEHRGSGLSKALFDAGLEWAWSRGVERVRLIVHEDNTQARALYRKIGFVPSGVTVPLSEDSGESELEMVFERS
ncbi:GNAT family N-acetyltransferase [Streptomyces gibsoniae]|uniref:GNAT family N-acetyltransferase n=1 Tax=Streptomyces gibsoniae TaxID=3075529 RepID=A0ABU2TR48_9ACTN|nr:GNAT family N-acetyltransferase [Streptomyces sp. DSM 41699]MDT0463438.1 GNAT family N-acetyltransferase [Streptomyces sp. DSM 41699]